MRRSRELRGSGPVEVSETMTRRGVWGSRWVFVMVAVVAVVIAVVGVVVSLWVKSPAQLASEQSPPPRGVLTATVQKHALSQTLTVRGTVVAPASSAVRVAGGGSGRVVTATPKKVGDTVNGGDALVEVSGRPVLVLQSEGAVYRDFTSGLKGTDVQQLQQALTRTGDLKARQVSGQFDWATQVAVRALYKRAGYATAGDGAEITVPMSEVVFVSSLPATVASLTATVGGAPSEGSTPLATLNVGGLQVKSTLVQGQQVGVAAGQVVHITDDVNGRKVDGTVTSVGAYTTGSSENGGAGGHGGPGDNGGYGANQGPKPGGGNQDGSGDQKSPGYPVLIDTATPLGADWLKLDVRVQIVGPSTNGPVLVVPSVAIVSDSTGGTVVLVREGSTNRRVPVTTGMIVEGEVQVTPVTPDGLKEGDTIVTG